MWVSAHLFPMIKDALWECSSWSCSSKGLSETEWFSYWKICFHVHKRGSSNWFFTDNDTSSLCKSLINTSYNIVWSLNFAQEDWFLEFWLSSKLTSIIDSSCSWNDLTSTSVNSVSMKSYIMNIKSDSSHVFIAHGSFFVPFAQAVKSLWFAAEGAGKLILSYLSGLVVSFANRRFIRFLQFFNYIMVIHYLLISINGHCFQNAFLI